MIDKDGQARAVAGLDGPAGRDYQRLLQAMSEALRVLTADGREEDALRASFEAAAQGFGAANALLLLVDGQTPVRLRCVQAHGRLTPAQIQACERGESVRGISASVIKEAIVGLQPVVVEDPRLGAGARETASLKGSHFSVLCAPILDPVRGSVLAVLYFQNPGLAKAYVQSDLGWLREYVSALGRLFGMSFERQRAQREIEELTQASGRPHDAPELIGDSEDTRALRRELHETYIPAVSVPDPEPILLLGEPGTGKDLVARYIHGYSSRRDRPFLAVNCAEIGEELATSRFFGHKRGAFTGASSDEPGFFRAADGGVLLLDEVGDLHPRAQAVLLRVLENRIVVPVGQTREIPVDVAVVLATNRDLDAEVESGRMRRDFYDRFRTQALRLTPLRHRPRDIHVLLDHFRSYHEARMRKRTLGFSPAALHALVAYPWPGNVRSLARACSLLVTHAKMGESIGIALVERCLPEVPLAAPNPRAARLLEREGSLAAALRTFKRELILSRLEHHRGDVRAARESLGLTRATFYRYAKALGLSPGSEPS
jgi:transcriptional regulator with GAF, ATPase, and Fis domain